jgi:uncharacterized lipoprotein YehR (DUF1307 family)
MLKENDISYYNPRLNDFYLGFEYEEKKPKDGKYKSKKIKNSDDLRDILYDYDHNYTDIYRVKRLSNECILNLDFIQQGDNLFSNKEFIITLNYKEDKPVVNINYKGNVYIDLLVNNKSELVKLLSSIEG